MKFPSLYLAFCLCLCLAGCGGSDRNDPAPAKGDGSQTETNSPRTPPAPDEPPKARTVEIGQDAKQALLDRVETMRKITAELKPLISPKSDPEGALTKEAALQSLFDEYTRLGKLAEDEGLTRFEIAGLTAKLAPDAWRDTQKEFTQYQLLVRQLGPAQRQMMDRVMGVKETQASELLDHLNSLSTPPATGKRPAKPNTD